MTDTITQYKKIYLKHPILAKKLLKGLRSSDFSPEIFNIALNYILGEYQLSEETKILIKNISYYRQQFSKVTIPTEIIKRVYSNWYLADPFRNIFPLVYSDIYDKYHIYSNYLGSYKNMISNYVFIKDPLNHEDAIANNTANKPIYEYKKSNKQIGIDSMADARVYFLLNTYEKIPSHNEFMKQMMISDHIDIENLYTTVPYLLTRLGLDLLYEDLASIDNINLMKKISSNYRDQLWIDKSLYEKKDYAKEIINYNILGLYNNYNQPDVLFIKKMQKIMNEYIIYLYLKDIGYTTNYSK